MFKDCLLFKERQEEIASHIITAFREGINVGNGLVTTIFGVAGTGKSEIAWWLARKLYCNNFSSHIMALDRFYKIPVLEREDNRRRTDIIGPDEMDWDRINEEIAYFKTLTNVDVLIIEGLYGGYVDPANIRVYLEGDISSTYHFRKLRGKENPDTEWRQFVLKKEQEAVVRSVHPEDEIYNANERMV